MSDRLFVATRKGVFTVERPKARPRARWAITRTHFLADNASLVLPDARDGAVYARDTRASPARYGAARCPGACSGPAIGGRRGS